MKSTGIVRGIDSLGRIVLPKELRTTLHLDGDTKLEIFVDGDAIVLKKHRPAGSCDFCGDVDAICGVLSVFKISRTNDRGCKCRKTAGEESPGFTGQNAG